MPIRTALALSLLSSYAWADSWQVIDSDFPDPNVIQTDDGYYAFGTTSGGKNAQVAHSSDFNTWDKLDTDALPGPFPDWVKDDAHPGIWAPDVIQRNDGSFVMYFSAAAREDDSKHCLGAATSDTITGPYEPSSDSLACPLDQGGAIDAAGFKDSDGTFYVVYKIDGNSLNGDGTTHPTPIMLQKLQSDAVTPDGDAVQLLDRDDNDGPLVEAPSLVKSGDTYFLSFSSNMYNTKDYDVSYATADSVGGPYTKVNAPDAPLLVSGDPSNVGDLGGPGGADFREDGKAILFHAFNNGENLDEGRGVWAANINIEDGVIHIE